MNRKKWRGRQINGIGELKKIEIKRGRVMCCAHGAYTAKTTYTNDGDVSSLPRGISMMIRETQDGGPYLYR